MIEDVKITNCFIVIGSFQAVEIDQREIHSLYNSRKENILFL